MELERGSLLGASSATDSAGPKKKCSVAATSAWWHARCTTVRVLFAGGAFCAICAGVITVTVLGLARTTATLADFLTYVPHTTDAPLAHTETGWFRVEYGPISAHGATSDVYFFQVPDHALNRVFLLTALVARGDGHGSVSHTQPSEVPLPMFFNLTEDRTSLLLFRKQTAIRASNAQDQVLLRDGVSDVLVTSLEVVKGGGDDGVRVLAGPLLEDHFKLKLEDVDPSFGAGSADPIKPARVVSVRGFPRNVNFVLEVSNEQHTIRILYCLALLPDEPMIPRFADPRIGYFSTAYVDIGMHQQNASHAGGGNSGLGGTPSSTGSGGNSIREFEVDPRRRVINKWRLEKDMRTCDETDTLCDPIKPILFHVDPTVPEVWRDAVRRGIELWQPAFADLGFRNTPRAVLPGTAEWPDDYDSGDIRFASVSFAVSQDYVFSVGPSIADPFTGEILDADIGFSQEWVRTFAGEVGTGELGISQKQRQRRRQYGGHNSASDNDRHVCSGHDIITQHQHQDTRLLQSRHGCQHARLRRGDSPDDDVQGDLAAAMRFLAMTSPDGRVPLSVIGDGLAGVTVHEVGHTLGLRHNFKASTTIPHEKIYDGSYTSIHSSSSSVMDYIGAVIPPTEAIEKAGNTIVFPDGRTIGAYDKLAIKYGYTAVDGESADRQHAEVAAIASELGAKGLVFGTDDDAGIKVDPLARRYDLTDDPVEYSADQLKIAQRMRSDDAVAKYQSWYPAQGFASRHKMYQSALRTARNAARNALYHVGGRVISHVFPGDTVPQGGEVNTPVAPVTAAYQRRAVEIVKMFLETPFYHDVANLKKLDQQVAYFALAEMEFGLNAPDMRADFDDSVEKYVLAPLLDIHKLGRIHATEHATLRGAPVWSPKEGARQQTISGRGSAGGTIDALGVYEVLESVTDSIWCQWDVAMFRLPHEWSLITTWTRGLIDLQNRTSVVFGAGRPTDSKSFPYISSAVARVRLGMHTNLTNSVKDINLTADPALHAFVDGITRLVACDLADGQTYCV